MTRLGGFLGWILGGFSSHLSSRLKKIAMGEEKQRKTVDDDYEVLEMVGEGTFG